MFIGHFALGFGAKKLAPTVSLGTLFAACQLADLVWPVLVLAGVEHVEVEPGNTAFTPLNFISYPFSHSAVALLAWACVFAGAYFALKRSTLGAAVTLGALVFSHWVLDVISHRPDMPVTLSGPTRLGLGLWQSVPATVAVEVTLFIACVWTYARATEARNSKGRYALWGLVAFLMVIYVGNIFGPPPPTGHAVALTATSMWLLVAWGAWIDRNRSVRGAA